mmetsp:Transcript_14894/g.35494  ORF Transcript_14894/g.35494 Transcript_14894/m.35494 type:complete len:208 (-) Transcript_14894:99-722(-)
MALCTSRKRILLATLIMNPMMAAATTTNDTTMAMNSSRSSVEILLDVGHREHAVIVPRKSSQADVPEMRVSIRMYLRIHWRYLRVQRGLPGMSNTKMIKPKINRKISSTSAASSKVPKAPSAPTMAPNMTPSDETKKRICQLSPTLSSAPSTFTPPAATFIQAAFVPPRPDRPVDAIVWFSSPCCSGGGRPPGEPCVTGVPPMGDCW